jgi:hypothetical protein
MDYDNNSTYLVYDKYNKTHNYDNELTKNITIDNLLLSNNKHLVGNDAIKKINKYDKNFKIELNLDKKLYEIHMFIDNNKGKYIIIKINNNILEKYITDNNIPNKNFLIKLCRYHYNYETIINKKIDYNSLFNKYNFIKVDNNIIANDLIKNINKNLGDVTDKMINNPDFLNYMLYDYQKRSIYWMLDNEKNKKIIYYSNNREVKIGKVYYDIKNNTFNLNKNKNKLIFNGGALIDEVGLGKTIQMITLCLLNPLNNLSYIKPKSNKFHSRATLIICPNQLCGQWKREFNKMIKKKYKLNIISILTKVHFNKLSYIDLLEADFVIVSYNFIGNINHLNQWMPLITNSKSYHNSNYNGVFNLDDVTNLFNDLGNKLTSNPSNLFNKNPNLHLIHWNRIIIDEFHEIFTIPKYRFLINLLPTLKSTYRWCITGTPFDKKKYLSLCNILNFITNSYKLTLYNFDKYNNKLIQNNDVQKYIETNMFRYNTKKSIMDEYSLAPIKESVIWLKFTSTERMMYNAYLANPYNDKDSSFLRKLCCHPKLANETKSILSNCKTLEDIERMMLTHYENDMNKTKKKVYYYKERIQRI